MVGPGIEVMQHRVISLLPSATEIVVELGYQHLLVGRSHECDFSKSIEQLPVCSEPRVDVSGSSREIDDTVRESMRDSLSIYRILAEQLRRLEPTIVITQTQCEVCAVSLRDVEAALQEMVGSQPTIVALAPMALSDIWDDVIRVAAAVGTESRGQQLVARLQSNLEYVSTSTDTSDDRPKVVCIEWLDPLMTAGNWTPELVKTAGGEPLLCESGKHSPWISWENLRDADPDYLVVMPCGFSIARTRQEAGLLTSHPSWNELRAVREKRVFIADGNRYFNRPGPRVVESAEILAEIFGRDQMQPKHQGSGWQQLNSD